MREATWRNYEDKDEWCDKCGCPIDPDGCCPFGPDCQLDDDELGEYGEDEHSAFDDELWQDRE